MPLLVWIKTNGQLYPQIWHTEQVTGTGEQKNADIIAHHKITVEEAALPLRYLLLDYPAPKGDQDADQT